MKERACSEIDPEETHQNDDSPYVVGKINGQSGSGPRLKYVVQWYGYSKTDGAAEPPNRISQHLNDGYWRRHYKRRRREALLGVN